MRWLCLLQYESFFSQNAPRGDSRHGVQLVEIGPLFLMTVMVIIMDEIGDDQHCDAKANPAGWSTPRLPSRLTPDYSSGLGPRCPRCWGCRRICCPSDGCQAAEEVLIKIARGNCRLEGVSVRWRRWVGWNKEGLWDGGEALMEGKLQVSVSWLPLLFLISVLSM